jgi:hypothetical protein
LECHSEKTKKQKPLLDTFDQVKAHSAASLQQIKSGKMPPAAGTNKPNAAEIKDFEKWVTDGTLLGLDPERTSTTASGTAYNNSIRDLLKEACVSCHKADGSQLPILTSFDKAAAAGKASTNQVRAGTMPPNSAKKQATIDKFQSWSDAGFPLTGLGSASGSSEDSSGTTPGTTSPCLTSP